MLCVNDGVLLSLYICTEFLCIWLGLCRISEGQSDQLEQAAEAVDQTDLQEQGLSSPENLVEREDPLGSVNGQTEVDNKENNNGHSAAEPPPLRYRNRLSFLLRYSFFCFMTKFCTQSTLLLHSLQ